MPSVDAVLAFVQVARLRSFSRAAEALGVPPSTLSRQVERLEARLGLRLLERTTRSMRLTAAGERYWERCVAVEQAVLEAERAAEELRDRPQGRITISVPTPLSSGFVMDAIAAYLAEHPGVIVSARIEDRPVDLLREGVDVAVRVGQRLADSTHLHARRLTQATPLLCATPAYLAARGRPGSLEALREHSLVDILWEHAGGRTDVDWAFVLRGRAVPFRAPARALVSSFAAVRGLVVAGAGIGVLPPSLCAEDLQAGRLAIASPALTLPSLSISAVTLGREHMPKRLRAFLKVLAAHAQASAAVSTGPARPPRRSA